MAKISEYNKITAQNKKDLMFSNRGLLILIVPLMIEQLLSQLMGTFDTIMVSNVGSAAVSAVSLVDAINILIIMLFAALAAGGSIVCSQYMGKGEPQNARRAAEQVIFAVVVISAAVTAVFVIFRVQILGLVFGEVESDVMENALTYFLLTAFSYPFIALFNACAAFFRAEKNSRLPMIVSVSCNCLNIVGNAIFIFGFGLGVFGAAISTLISRIVMAVVMLAFEHRPAGRSIYIKRYLSIRPNLAILGLVLAMAIPNAIENGTFQFGKLAIQSTVSTLGTTAIAAQALAIVLEALNGVMPLGAGIALLTIVGQCMGAGKKDQAIYYIKKVTFWAELTLIASCIVIWLLVKPVTALSGMEAESARICFNMMTFISIVKPIVWVWAFVPAYGLRAAGDVKFSMIVTICTMWIFRVMLAIYLMRVVGIGPMGVWVGMAVDWTVRSIIFYARFRSGKWLDKKVIEA